VLYVLAIVASPVAVWFCGRPGHAAANLALWFLAVPAFIVSGLLAVLLVPIIDALFVLNDYQAEQQARRLAGQHGAIVSRPR